MRKPYPRAVQCPIGSIFEPRDVDFIDENGIHRRRIDYVDISTVESRIPRPCDYTLDMLLKAGVPLKEVPVSGLLNNSSKLEQSAVNRVLNVIDGMLSKENKEKEVPNGEVGVDKAAD